MVEVVEADGDRSINGPIRRAIFVPQNHSPPSITLTIATFYVIYVTDATTYTEKCELTCPLMHDTHVKTSKTGSITDPQKQKLYTLC